MYDIINWIWVFLNNAYINQQSVHKSYTSTLVGSTNRYSKLCMLQIVENNKDKQLKLVKSDVWSYNKHAQKIYKLPKDTLTENSYLSRLKTWCNLPIDVCFFVIDGHSPLYNTQINFHIHQISTITHYRTIFKFSLCLFYLGTSIFLLWE